MRDCVNKLKQYIACSPDEEKPSQARLISMFLEGLKNWTLYAHLYACRHRTFNECCIDAMNFDNNFNASSTKNNKDKWKSTDSDSSSSGEPDPDKIVEAGSKDWAKHIDHLIGQWDINKRLRHHLQWAHTCVEFVQSRTKLRIAHHICPVQTNLLRDACAKCVDGTQRISQGIVDTLIVWREKGTMLDKVARFHINKTTKVGTFETIHTKKWQDQC